MGEMDLGPIKERMKADENHPIWSATEEDAIADRAALVEAIENLRAERDNAVKLATGSDAEAADAAVFIRAAIIAEREAKERAERERAERERDESKAASAAKTVEIEALRKRALDAGTVAQDAKADALLARAALAEWRSKCGALLGTDLPERARHTLGALVIDHDSRARRAAEKGAHGG